MKMRVVMSGSSSGLENNNVSNVEFYAGADVENIFETGMSWSHEWAEQFGSTVKPYSQELRHGQDHMAISNARQEPPADEIGPAVGVNLGTEKTRGRLIFYK